jgi:Fe2+ transport system protein FeoA
MHDRRAMRRFNRRDDTCRDRLIACRQGEKVKIVNIDAGRGAMINLMNLGLNIGDTVEIRRKSHLHGPLIVIQQNSEIAIGFGLAQKIVVERLT